METQALPGKSHTAEGASNGASDNNTSSVASAQTSSAQGTTDTNPQHNHADHGDAMCVQESRVYRGPNPYGYRPVVRFKIALGRLENYPTDRLGDFIDRLLEVVPTLNEHGCSSGEIGGFVRLTGLMLGNSKNWISPSAAKPASTEKCTCWTTRQVCFSPEAIS